MNKFALLTVVSTLLCGVDCQIFTAAVEVLPGFTFRWQQRSDNATSSIYVVGEFNYSDRSQWSAVGLKSGVGMDGLNVICSNAGSSPKCQDWAGSGNSIELSSSNAATVVRSTGLPSGGMSIVWERIVVSQGADLGVAAWGTPARVIFGLGPMSHGSSAGRHVGRQTISAALADFKTGYITFDAPNPGTHLNAVIAWLILTGLLVVISLGVRLKNFKVHHHLRTGFGFGAMAAYFGVWIWYMIASVSDYTKMAKLHAQASATGDGAAVAFAALLISGSRRFFTQDLIGVSHERMIIYHLLAGLCFFMTFCIHGGFMLQMFAVQYASQWPSQFIPPLPGLLAGVISFALIATALLRNKLSYKVFRATHGLWALVVVFTLLHLPRLYIQLLPGLVLLALSLLYGRAANGGFRIISLLRHEHAELTEIVVGRPHVRAFDTSAVPSIGIAPGQWMYLHTFDISLLWHPFSIAEARVVGDEQQLRFFVKSTGNKEWTDKLGTLSQATPVSLREIWLRGSSPTGAQPPLPECELASPCAGPKISLRLEGPFGRLQLPLDSYQELIFVSGGVGITPNLLCLQHISERIGEEPRRWRRILWIFTAQNAATISVFFPYMAQHLNKLIANGVEAKMIVNCSREAPPLMDHAHLGELSRGRPNLLKTLSDWKSSETAAMYVCGPGLFMDDAKDAAAKCGGIHIHDEVFNV